VARTTPNVLGPFYRGPSNGYVYSTHRNRILPGGREGSLWLKVYVRDDTTEQLVHFASVEAWQADTSGVYDNSNPRDPTAPNEFWPNTAYYRGRFQPYGACHFCTLYTETPGQYYQPPVGGQPGFLRERHIHFRISKPGYDTLVTQVFFPRDPGAPPSEDPYYVPANTVTLGPTNHGVTSGWFVFRL
jgi:protocatechuate 3,4-dioxygenase beta subunit